MVARLTPAAIAALKRRMLAVPAKVTKAVQAEMEAQAQGLADAVRRDVPIDDGDLRNSVKVESGTDEYGAPSARVSVGDRRAFHAGWVEFGTSRQPAQPFFYPNYRARKRRIRAAITRAMKRALKT